MSTRNNISNDDDDDGRPPGISCEHCKKHLPSFHDARAPCGSKGCPQCLPSSLRALHRCAKCNQSYYCGKACQKAAWKDHRQPCLLRSRPSISAQLSRCNSLTAWCNNSLNHIAYAATGAARLAARPHAPVGDYVFLVYVDAEARGDTHVYRVRSARGVARSSPVVRHRIQKMYEAVADRLADYMRARAHQLLVMPGIIQAFVIDTGAHFPYEAVFVKAADFGEPFVRDDWLVRFKAAVDAT